MKQVKKGRCIRCGREFDYPFNDRISNVCGNCDDELRSEEDAAASQAEAEAELMAQAQWAEEEALAADNDRRQMEGWEYV